MSGLLGELRRRNVIRMAGVYLVGAWLVVQVSETVLPVFDVPTWVLRAIIVLLAIGFVPALVISWIFELTPEGLKRDGDVAPEHSIAPQTGRRLERLFLVLFALVLVFLAADRFLLMPAREAALVDATAESVRAETRASLQAETTGRSIAVLPFANLSGEVDPDYFSDGLAEDLITALTQLPELRVISRNSSFRFRDAVDSRAVGAQLDVAHLLTGSVRRHGEQVRIVVNLVDVRDGSTRWSQRFDRAYADLFALQDDIARAVAGEMKTRLAGDLPTRTDGERPPGGDLRAYNAWLRGDFHASRTTPEDDRKAIAAYEEAIAIDPEYARAYAALAGVLTWHAAHFQGGDEAQQAYARARELVARAMELQPDMAYAYYILGEERRLGELDVLGANAALERAVQLAPRDPTAVTGLAAASASLGNLDRAIALAQQAAELDPLAPTTHYWLSAYLAGAGRFAEAETAVRRARELEEGDSANVQLVAVQLLQGRHAEALQTAQSLEDPLWRELTVALALQKSPDPAAAGTALSAIVDKYADDGAFQIAEMYALRGDADKTFEWLQRARANRDSGLEGLLFDPFFIPYRDDPRFADLRTHLGLPPGFGNSRRLSNASES